MPGVLAGRRRVRPYVSTGVAGEVNGEWPRKTRKGTKTEDPSLLLKSSLFVPFRVFRGHSPYLRAKGLFKDLGQLRLGGEADDLVQRLVAALEDQHARDGGHV